MEQLGESTKLRGTVFITGIEHHNGTATTSPATVTLAHRVMTLLIDNLSTSNKLGVSFDGGSTYKTLNAGANLGIDYFTTSIMIKALTNTVDYEIMGGY